jgi:hypothetical protein
MLEEDSMSDATHVKLDVAQSGLTPWKLIQTYSPAEWEDFIVEWSEGFTPAYFQVVKLGGAGDKGRDVIGYLGDPQTACEWDSYQCKHYDHALMPSEIYGELGKLCVFTHRGDFSVPRRYRFVAPCGVGTSLHDLLKKRLIFHGSGFIPRRKSSISTDGRDFGTLDSRSKHRFGQKCRCLPMSCNTMKYPTLPSYLKHIPIIPSRI